MIQIGPHQLRNQVFVAPMAGVTDRPYRQLCKRLGAGYAVSEMAASNALLWATEKTSRRINHDGEIEPKAVQIAGGDPAMMADAAAFNVERGAQIIDLNMGCPAKKVCNLAAGSALMSQPKLVAAIVEAVVQRVGVGAQAVPVTIKIRTGPHPGQRNALEIAQIAESAGISLITIHGRTRADLYKGQAEYDTIANVKSRVRIPVVANGDVDSPEKAREVLRYTGADAVMIGRAAQGRPWIFREVAHFLATGERLPAPEVQEIRALLVQHLLDHYEFHGEIRGVRCARKHIAWYVKGIEGAQRFREHMMTIENAQAQLEAVDAYFEALAQRQLRMPEIVSATPAQRNPSSNS